MFRELHPNIILYLTDESAPNKFFLRGEIELKGGQRFQVPAVRASLPKSKVQVHPRSKSHQSECYHETLQPLPVYHHARWETGGDSALAALALSALFTEDLTCSTSMGVRPVSVAPLLTPQVSLSALLHYYAFLVHRWIIELTDN